MPASGADLGANLYDLWKAGRDNLPSVAAEYAMANRSIADTDVTLAGAFRRPDQFGGPFGPAYEAWRGLRDEFQTMLADTATYLDLTGDLLCIAADGYARTDEAARQELDRLKRDNGNPTPPDVPTVQYPY